MTKTEIDLLNYIVVCISEFAAQHGMNMTEAYVYLKEHKGLDFLKEFYDVEHTLSFDDVMDDLASICRNNGGTLP